VDRPVPHIFGLGQAVAVSQCGERPGGELLEDLAGGTVSTITILSGVRRQRCRRMLGDGMSASIAS
jgi:hypothetical protein